MVKAILHIYNILQFFDYIKTEFHLNIDEIENFAKIKSSMLNSYMVGLTDISNSLKATKMYAIKSFFEFLLDDEYIDNNPCNKIKIPKDNKEHEVVSLTQREINKIKRNILKGVGDDLTKHRQEPWKKRDYAVVMLALSLGLRVISISEINIDDINFETNELKIVEKGNKIRTLMFSDGLAEILLEWVKDREEKLEDMDEDISALFISRQHQRLTAPSIRAMIKKYTYNIDKKITPHKLRSTCATNVYEQTGDIYLTADILGHSNIQNTKRYASISEEKKKKAASAMDNILFN